jgi:hypothetical protein
MIDPADPVNDPPDEAGPDDWTPPERPAMPLYVVVSGAGALGTMFGGGSAQLCRRDDLPNGRTVYRPESTGRLADLASQAQRLNLTTEGPA